jgi:nuclear GTP-binding protein
VTEDPTQRLSEELLQILKKVSKKLRSDEKPVIAIGVVGMPNVGKSSLINALKHSRACAFDT